MLVALILLLLILEIPRNLLNKVDPIYVCSEISPDDCPFPPRMWDGSKFISIAGLGGMDTVMEFLSFGNQTLSINDMSCRFYPETFVVQNVTLFVFLETTRETRMVGDFFCSANSDQKISVTRYFPIEKGKVFVKAKYGAPPSLLSYITASGAWLI